MKKSKRNNTFYKQISNRQYLLHFLFSQQLFFFFFGSLMGFLWEVLLYLIQDGTFIKRGFFHGPWLPIYGTGAVTFYLLLAHPIRQAKFFLGESPQTFSAAPADRVRFIRYLKLFLLSLTIGTTIELAIGWFLDTFWGLRYWTYEGVPFNFHGYICLSSSICFGIAGVLWVGFLAERLTRLWLKIPSKIREEINTILVLLFLLDCVAALLLPNMGDGITFH